MNRPVSANKPAVWMRVALLLTASLFAGTVFANQCSGLFDHAVQSHNGTIALGDDVSLATPAQALPSAALTQAESQLSCNGAACTSTNQSSIALSLPPFIATNSTETIFQPANSASTFIVQFTNEFAKVDVGEGSTIEFSSNHQFYAIKEFTAENDTTIILAPGDYWIESLSLRDNVQLITSGGQVRLFVRDYFDAGFASHLNEQSSANFMLVAWDQVNFRGNNIVNANIYSANYLHVSTSGQFKGALSAGEISIMDFTNVTYNQTAPEILKGLCSDFGPLPDADADGLPDGIDPDVDNDGYLNYQESELGSDANNTNDIPDFGFNTVSDGLGNLVDSNQCTDTFGNGLQSHAIGGRVKFHYRSQLLNGSSLAIEAETVLVPRWRAEQTCETGECYATGAASIELPSKPLLSLNGNETISFAPRTQNHLEASAQSDRYQRIVQKPRGELKLDAQGGDFIAGNVWIKPRSILILTPGDYHFNALVIGSLSELKVEGEGTVRIYLKDDFVAMPRAKINAPESDEKTAQKLLVVGEKRMLVAYRADVFGWFYISGRTVNSGDITGGVSSNQIRLTPRAKVRYDYTSLWQTDFDAHCDIDSDGLYDLFDEDRDGDGISNEFEKQLGFNPNDASHTPVDQDQDSIPDLLDDDRDGDGVLNTDDVFPDDASEWADLDGDGQGDNADTDRDGDGYSNEEEIEKGTDPNDAASYPDVTPPELTVEPVSPLTQQMSISVSAVATDSQSAVSGVTLQNITHGYESALELVNGSYQGAISLEEGENELLITATDSSANSISVSRFVNRDSTSPSIVIVEPTTAAFATGLIRASLQVSDSNSGVVDVRAYVNEAAPTQLTLQPDGVYTADILLAEGENNYVFAATDAAGNSAQVTRTYLSDVTPPQFSNWNIPSLVNTETANVTVEVMDSLSDIATVIALLNGEEMPLELTSVGSTVAVSGLANLVEGVNTIRFEASDELGNSLNVDVQIVRDTEAPEISITSPLEGAWVATNSLELTGAVTDSTSGIEAITYRVNSNDTLPLDEAFSETITLQSGTNTITVNARDLAGNDSEVVLNLGYDETPPTITIDQVANTANPTEWVANATEFTFTGNVTDADSGVKTLSHILGDSSNVAFDENGVFTHVVSLNEGANSGRFLAEDNAGIQREWVYQISRDTTAPISTSVVNGQLISDGLELLVNNPSIALVITATDDGSGVANASLNHNNQPVLNAELDAEVNVTLTEGVNTFSLAFADSANNSTVQTFQVVLDSLNPTINWLSSLDTTAQTDYTAMWTVEDSSAISSQTLQINGVTVAELLEGNTYVAEVTLQPGMNTILLTATDAAGNSEVFQASVEADNAQPEVTLNTLPEITGEKTLLVSGSVQDNSSVTLVINQQAVQIDADGEFSIEIALADGANTINLLATDALGNASSLTQAIVSDQAGPVLNVSTPATTTDDVITISGSVTDAISDVSVVTVTNITSGTAYMASVSGSVFTANVPLLSGFNSLEVVATDSFANESKVPLSIEYLASGIQWFVQSHVNNQTVVDDSIVLQGVMVVEDSLENLTANIGGLEASVTPISATEFAVRSASLALEFGDNVFAIELFASGAQLVDNFTITRAENVDPEPGADPVLTVNSPANNAQWSGQYVVVSGEVESDSAPVITVNGIQASTTTSIPFYRFNETIEVVATSNTFEITIVATFADGTTLTETRSLKIDNTPPVVAIENALLAFPAVTTVLEDPFVLRGSVIDANMNSITLNGNLLALIPVGNNAYEFEAAVSLPNNVETQLDISANDAAGNTSSISYVVRAERVLDVSWLLPLDNSALITYGEPFPVQVVLQSSENTTAYSYQVRINNETNQTIGDWSVMAFSNGTAVSDIQLDGSEGDFTLEARVVDPATNLIAQIPPRSLTVRAPEQVPLELLKTSPSENEVAVNTKEQIGLFFNQAIDPTKLTVSLHETAHGRTWINQDAPGTEFFNAQGHQLVEVDREFEPLGFDMQVLPDNKTVLLQPTREPAYQATVFVEVQYDGVEYARYQFETKKLPTLVNMILRDQFDRPVPNIQVQFAGEIAYSDGSGFVQFGSSDAKTIEPTATGRYSVLVNSEMLNPAYGETKLDVEINGGELNQLGVLPVSFLNPEFGATYLQSGTNHALNEGDVLLDLTNASIVMPYSGAPQGAVHVQFNTAGFNYPTHPLVEPSWLYSFQPLGIQLNGSPSISLELPQRNNSYAYLPEDGTLVLVLAVDPNQNIIDPVTVGELNGTYVDVLYSESIEVLDHLGVAFLPVEFQPLMNDYKNGDVAFQVFMANMAELARSINVELMEE